MSANDEHEWWDYAKRQVRSYLYSVRVPVHLYSPGDEPADEDTHIAISREVIKAAWNEIITLIDEEGYSAARELEKGLRDRLEEIRKQEEMYDNEYRYVHLERELIKQDMRTYGPDTALQNALASSASQLEQRGWRRITRSLPAEATAWRDAGVSLGPRSAVQHRVPAEHLKAEGISPCKPSTFPVSFTFEEAAQNLMPALNGQIDMRARARRTAELTEFRLHVVQNVLYRREVTGSVTTIREEEAEELAQQDESNSTGGRKRIIDDEEAHPEEILKAIIEWTGNESNREHPFFTTTDDGESLCRSVARHIESVLDYESDHEISQHTIRSQIKALMRQLSVDLPSGVTRVSSYFAARDEIKQKLKNHFNDHSLDQNGF